MSNCHGVLELKAIYKKYEGEPLLKGISFQVNCGETLCLLGRSGSGKSTLLRIIAGLESPDAGDVLWNGESIMDVPTYQRNFGLMFQDYALFPHLNVMQNVAFGLRMQQIKKVSIHDAVLEALELVNMNRFATRSVTDLSGGEQQRIALARSLAAKPRLLMLDEPLAALDRALRVELQEELRSLLQKTSIPAIYVTHDQEEAFILGDRIAILADGEVAQSGTPQQVYRRPKNRKVAEFLGMTNFLFGKVVSTDPLLVETAAGLLEPKSDYQSKFLIDQVVTLLIQSAEVAQESRVEQHNCLIGIVKQCIYRGSDYKVTLETGHSGMMTFYVREPAEVGSTLILQPENKAIVVLDD